MSEEGENPEGNGGGEEVTPEAYEALKAEKATVEAELAKLREKDMNFKAFRTGTLANLTEEEKQKYIGDELEAVSKKQEEFHKSQVTERVEDALDVFAGEDKEAREKLKFHYDRIRDEATSRKEVLLKMKEAAKLADLGAVSADTFARAASHYGSPSAPKAEKRFSDSEKGEAFRKGIGMPDPIESARSAGLYIKPEFLNKK